MEILLRELEEHKELLRFWGKLPTDIRKLVQDFHKSSRPVLGCRHCHEQYYELSCFHTDLIWCVNYQRELEVKRVTSERMILESLK